MVQIHLTNYKFRVQTENYGQDGEEFMFLIGSTARYQEEGGQHYLVIEQNQTAVKRQMRLPVRDKGKIDQAVTYINSMPRPLTL